MTDKISSSAEIYEEFRFCKQRPKVCTAALYVITIELENGTSRFWCLGGWLFEAVGSFGGEAGVLMVRKMLLVL